ncbi:MAG TPA: pyridoxal-phosphate dependent enzyme [Chryseolinea sp.]|nr:pyridoxal-phosphate dependent enzyme [Chryseolinea sp.]
MTPRLSTSRIDYAFRTIDPVFLRTPQFISESLSELFSSRVVLKVETLNPIRSFKGRGADFLLANADKNTPIICASAGNFGQAMAYACRKRNVQLAVYASVHANPLKIERMKALGADVILHGNDFDAAKLEAKNVAKASGTRFVEDSLDIETLEGAGTIGLELLDFPEPIDVLLVALGNGAMINGIGRIFKERSPHTRIIAVQAAGAPAMIESWRTNTLVTHNTVNTIADGIAVRIPVPEALTDMQGVVDDAILVSETSIVNAMNLVHLHAGLVSEPSGAVGIAALMENINLFKGITVATIICGGNVAEQQLKEWCGING